MRISDWSSDVCSSDLPAAQHRQHPVAVRTEILRQGGSHAVEREIEQEDIDAPAVEAGAEAFFPFHCRRVAIRDPMAGDLGQIGGVLTHEILEIGRRSEEHTSELQSLMRISYAVFCSKKKKSKILNSSH